MLIEFAATNYRSIRERQAMSFRVSGQINKNEHPENIAPTMDKSHGSPLLRTAILYGANASGKSNMLRAIQALKQMVLNSDTFKLDQPISFYDPFRLDQGSRSLPTIFEIDFLANDRRRYQFHLAFDQKRVLREELYFFPTGREVSRKKLLYKRTSEAPTEFGDDYRGKRDFALLDHQLLLTKAGLEALPSLTAAYRFFSTYFFFAAAQTDDFEEAMLQISERALSDTADSWHRDAVVSLVKAADTGISNLFVQDLDEPKVRFSKNAPHEVRHSIIEKFRRRIKTVHPLVENGEETGKEIFDLSDESTGTLTFLGLAGFVADALYDGSVVMMDELDKHLHPLLTRMIIGLFHHPETNPNNAQLIFSSHDVSLIDRDLFRRDQVYLMDRGLDGASSIGRLSDFTGISKVAPLMKWYMMGMFKGVPATNSYQIDLKFENKTGHA